MENDHAIQHYPQTLETTVLMTFAYTGQPPEHIPRDISHVTVDPSVKIIEERAFENCQQLLEVVFHDRLTTIGQSSFSGCTTLQSIHVPNSVETIGQRAFSNCSSLRTVTLPDLLVLIRNGTFQGCCSLQKISVPRFVASIQSSAFENCESLVDIELPEGLTSIRYSAFASCKSLAKVRVPSTVKTIGRSCFQECSALVDVELPKQLRSLSPFTFDHCESLESILLPEALESIKNGALRNCYSLVSISIPSRVESIYDCAFYGCTSLAHVRLQEGLKSIREKAFACCESLCGIALPRSIECIEYSAFRSCSNLLGVEMPAEIKKILLFPCFESSPLVNLSLPASIGESCRACFRRSRFRGLASDFIDRYARLPVHEVCYYSSISSVQDLEQALKADADTCTKGLEDAFGLTPFHVVATSVNPRCDLLECLLGRYPGKVLFHKDRLGKTMMDYLLMRTSSEFVPLIQMVLDQAVLLDGTQGMRWADMWRSRLSLRIGSINEEDDKETRRVVVNGIMEYFGHCASVEMILLTELALWKRKIAAVQRENPGCEIDRASCRFQCQADVVLENVVGYLWEDDTRTQTALSSFPLSGLYSVAVTG